MANYGRAEPEEGEVSPISVRIRKTKEKDKLMSKNFLDKLNYDLKSTTITVTVLFMAITLLTTMAYLAHMGHSPRLIGHGCEGATGPLYANEESDFPMCDRIERIR